MATTRAPSSNATTTASTPNDATNTTAARKAAGSAKFGGAAAAQKATTGLPARKGRFNVPGGSTTFTGKDARIATFNSHLNAASPVGDKELGGKKKAADRQPKTFRNDPHELAKPGTIKPIDNMVGKGREYPITAGKPKGYEGDHRDLGSARVITQETKNMRTVKSGKGTKTVPETVFQGVIAHDSSRAPGRGNGYNDHFKVPFTPPPPHP